MGKHYSIPNPLDNNVADLLETGIKKIYEEMSKEPSVFESVALSSNKKTQNNTHYTTWNAEGVEWKGYWTEVPSPQYELKKYCELIEIEDELSSKPYDDNIVDEFIEAYNKQLSPKISNSDQKFYEKVVDNKGIPGYEVILQPKNGDGLPQKFHITYATTDKKTGLVHMILSPIDDISPAQSEPNNPLESILSNHRSYTFDIE